uniref:BTB domain-containing protein n=1 Tax=Anopheles funestus TaxID=62324 RepID=A0A4Y0BMX2_ANOFN
MDDDQQFCLRWNNHQSTLISVIDTLLENGTLVDCTLAAEGKFLKAHKVVLSACSPYFATLLSQQYDKHPIFILKDVKFQELRAMMDYMYRGEVNISQDQLAALLKAAESLQIKGLSDNRSSSSAGTGGGAQKGDATAVKSLQPPVPASKASGLTIENKRSLKSELHESDMSGSREGSSSPTSRKRKKVRRRSVDTNNLLIDNHDQHSNSSSHSMHTGSGANVAALAVTGTTAANVAASSLSSSSSTAAAGSNSSANVLSVAAVAAAAALKKTETVQQAAAETLKLQKQQQQAAAAAAAAAQSSDDDERCGGPGSVATGTEHDDGNDLSDNEHDGDGGSSVKSGSRHHHLRDGSRRGKMSTSSMGEMMIEPKSEYEDVQDENVEDLTMDDEDLMDELDQPGPSHGGDVSSQGYAQWPMEREQNEAFIAAQDAVGGQHRDAQVSVPVGEAGDIDGGRPLVGGTEGAAAAAAAATAQDEDDDPGNEPGHDDGAAATVLANAAASGNLGSGSSSVGTVTTIANSGTAGNSVVDSKGALIQGCTGSSSSASSSSSTSSNSSSASNSNSSHSCAGVGSVSATGNSDAAAAAIAMALNQQQPANISVGSSAAAAAAAVVAFVGGPLMAEYIKSDVGVTFPLSATQPSPPIGSSGGGGGGGVDAGEGSSHKQQQLVSSLKLQSQTQPLALQHHQQQSQTAALPLLSPKSPPIDEQPCDLRMLTPATYLREFASSVKPESFAAAAATAIKLAATANTGSASTTAALPMPMFKGISMTTPPPPPMAMPSPIVGGTYSCTRCGNSYARPHSLNRHIRFECGVEPKFECPVCHKKSKHKHNLVLHMRTHQHR